MDSKKYKLIIIDDEYVVIKGLKTTIDWAALNIEIVAECRNGEDGLEAIERLKPDLVISDIRMPKLDGLSLAKKLSEDNFDGAIIIHSGYSDFEYARLAIDYGVTKYILKPIENKDFIRCIEEALQELEIDRKKRKALEQYTMGLPFIKENLIEQVITGNNAAEAIQNLKLIGITLPPYGIVIEGSLLKKAGGGCHLTTFGRCMTS